MKNFLLRATVLIIAALAVSFVLHRHHPAPVANAPAPPALPANQDARALTPAETQTFLPLICTRIAILPADADVAKSYEDHCGALPGYPNPDFLDTENDLSLTSIMFGHFTDEVSDQAYVSYLGSFEPHVNNFGGGILFQKSTGGWALVRWYPGMVMDGCLMLKPDGKAKMLCLFSGEGQGELDTSLQTVTVPASYDTNAGNAGSWVKILTAGDLRQTGSPEDNCTARKSPDQDILLSIDNLARSKTAGIFAVAGIHYVPAATAGTACAAGDFANAPTTAATLNLQSDGNRVTVMQGHNFAPAGW